MRKDFSYLCHLGDEKWEEIQMYYFHLFSKQSSMFKHQKLQYWVLLTGNTPTCTMKNRMACILIHRCVTRVIDARRHTISWSFSCVASYNRSSRWIFERFSTEATWRLKSQPREGMRNPDLNFMAEEKNTNGLVQDCSKSSVLAMELL